MNQLTVHFVSDIHGYKPRICGGDILLIGGDHCSHHGRAERGRFCDFVKKCLEDYDHVVYIAGNHDIYIGERRGDRGYYELNHTKNAHYLCDSEVELKGLRIYGSPHTQLFPTVNPLCTAFMDKEENIAKHFEKIPTGIHILMTHSPPYGILDKNIKGKHCGSPSLLKAAERVRPFLHVFGHIHEGFGEEMKDGIRFVNCSYVNENYSKRDGFPFL